MADAGKSAVYLVRDTAVSADACSARDSSAAANLGIPPGFGYNNALYPQAILMSDPKRLSKRLMELVQCSRREAELYIQGGWVSVDGVVVEQPQVKVEDEQVVLHPEADLASAAPVSIIVHSAADQSGAPEGQVDPSARWPEDDTQLQTLACHFRQLQPCLSLPKGVEGMQVLTQDQGLARYLASAQANLEQEFVVQVEGELTPAQLALLNHGLSYQGKPLRPAKVSWQSERRLRFALKNPLAGQFASMCEQVGLRVQHIKRIRIGAIPLRKMALNQWRYLPDGARF